MNKKQFSSTQIASILKEFVNSKITEEVTHDHGVNKAPLHK